jgi:prophage antirepressor-like protein
MTNKIIPFQYNNKKIYAIIIDGKEWFVARYICDILEYSNSSDAIKKHCKIKGVAKRYIPTSSGIQEMTIINLSNLLRLIMRSKMKEAENFQDWVFDDVLPAILKNGKYSMFEDLKDPILQHCDETVQKTNSKIINSINYHSGGVEKIKEHNTEICKMLTTKTPSEIKKIGKEKYNLKSKDTTSAKQVLRAIAPYYSQAMSFTENLLQVCPDKKLSDLKKSAEQATSLYKTLFDENIILEK